MGPILLMPRTQSRRISLSAAQFQNSFQQSFQTESFQRMATSVQRQIQDVAEQNSWAIQFEVATQRERTQSQRRHTRNQSARQTRQNQVERRREQSDRVNYWNQHPIQDELNDFLRIPTAALKRFCEATGFGLYPEAKRLRSLENYEREALSQHLKEDELTVKMIYSCLKKFTEYCGPQTEICCCACCGRKDFNSVEDKHFDQIPFSSGLFNILRISERYASEMVHIPAEF